MNPYFIGHITNNNSAFVDANASSDITGATRGNTITTVGALRIEQIYTGCLAQGAYYIESNGEVAIIDPLRETQQYVDKANNEQAKIKYIFETHFHADFVSGHIDLSQ